MKPLVNPVVNLNGNSADSLIDQLRGVLDAVRELEIAMASASDIIHGRNFQTMAAPDIAQREAQVAWHERFVMINKFEHDLTNMALDIQRQQRERERT